MRVEVLKPFQAGDRRLKTGEIVDASGWRLLRQLIEQRYVREAPPKSRSSAKEATHA